MEGRQIRPAGTGPNGTALYFLRAKDAGRRCGNTYDPLTTNQLIKELTHG